jgi:HEAT repeat protein
MRKRKMLLLTLSSILAIAILLWAVLRSPEPRYQGHSLSAWLHIWAFSHTVKQPEEAKQATIQIGTNAVPFLLQYIRYKPPRWKKPTTTAFRKLKDIPLAGRLIPLSMTIDEAAVRAETAVYAFDALRETAAYAYPDLARIACDSTQPEASERAIRVLILRRASATDAIGLVLSNAPPQIRLKTLHYVGGQHDQALLHALQPVLLQRLHDDDDEVARWAAINLTELKHTQPEAILALLLDALKSTTPKVRAVVIECISTYDTAAIPAVPSLVPFLADADPTVRKQTTNILRMIDPQALTNAPARTPLLLRPPR